MSPSIGQVALRDGRRLRFREHGMATGAPVIALHGTPGSGLKFAGNQASAERAGLRLICPDRWGYGGTDPPAHPALAEYAADIAGLADALAIERFGLLGVSGGAPFAVAAASGLGDRVTRTALVCPVGPVAEMAASRLALLHRLSFRVLPRIPGAARLTFSVYRAVMQRLPELALRLAATRACADDLRLLRDPAVRDGLTAAFRDGMASGVDGCVIDMGLFARPWRLDLSMLGAARVWIGALDGNVPIAAARELARLIRADLAEIEGRGHFWIAAEDHDVWSWLAKA